MQLITCHDGQLLTLEEARLHGGKERSFSTTLEPLDALAPGGVLARAAIHELLFKPEHGTPLFFAMIFARAACASGPLIWSDPHHQLYPPALAAHGVSLDRLFLLHSGTEQQTWAIGECLGCKGVGAVVAAVPRLSRVEARRLQLAAERGRSAGIFLRPAGKAAEIYAAATRWLVSPAPGERTLQRWKIQLLHGHGGRIGQTVTLEYCRENHLVRVSASLVDRSSSTKVVARAS